MAPLQRIILLSMASIGIFGFGTGNALAADGPQTPALSSSPLAGPAMLPTAGLSRITNAELGRIRGGYSPPGFSGIIVNFGYTSQTFVNGSLVQSIVSPVMNIVPSIGQYTANNTGQNSNQPKNQALNSSPTSVSTAVAGISNQVNQAATTITNTMGSAGQTTLISNTMNNSAIQTMRTFNIDISGLQSQVQSAAQANRLTSSLAPR